MGFEKNFYFLSNFILSFCNFKGNIVHFEGNFLQYCQKRQFCCMIFTDETPPLLKAGALHESDMKIIVRFR